MSQQTQRTIDHFITALCVGNRSSLSLLIKSSLFCQATWSFLTLSSPAASSGGLGATLGTPRALQEAPRNSQGSAGRLNRLNSPSSCSPDEKSSPAAGSPTSQPSLERTTPLSQRGQQWLQPSSARLLPASGGSEKTTAAREGQVWRGHSRQTA